MCKVLKNIHNKMHMYRKTRIIISLYTKVLKNLLHKKPENFWNNQSLHKLWSKTCKSWPIKILENIKQNIFLKYYQY